jgi:urease accessory protein
VLDIAFAMRQGVTRLTRNAHSGPLRVLKPFYPEGSCCHIYLLHPPGGLVLGDELTINVHAQTGSSVLLTTPSAGKIYGVKHAQEQQIQHVNIHIDEDASVEWLPQETLVFSGANAALLTRIHLAANAKLVMWDVVCLGRPASQLLFEQGQCLQAIHIERDGIPIFIERNFIEGGQVLQHSEWGLNGDHSRGTFIASSKTSREQRMAFIDYLTQRFKVAGEDQKHRWGITQKDDLCIARYLGDSAVVCRQGFEYLWQQLRPAMLNKSATVPRIWAT